MSSTQPNADAPTPYSLPDPSQPPHTTSALHPLPWQAFSRGPDWMPRYYQEWAQGRWGSDDARRFWEDRQAQWVRSYGGEEDQLDEEDKADEEEG